MGCDIHMVLQSRRKGIWHTISMLDINRNYNLFSILAMGVRGKLKSISAPRGLPVDIKYLEMSEDMGKRIFLSSLNPNTDYWLGEHSFSYLFIREILKHYTKHWTNVDIRESLEYFLGMLSKHIKKKGVYRVVFGFDS